MKIDRNIFIQSIFTCLHQHMFYHRELVPGFHKFVVDFLQLVKI